jgi:hypothetical protein
MLLKSPFFTVFLILTCQTVSRCRSAEIVLPVGSSPAPIVERHFPSRLHEYVWRNWNLVEPAKLAKVIGASTDEILAVAESMGLPRSVAIPPEVKSRGYITVIRRNWHLLPYEQLLDLVAMTPERMAFTLRDEDGVFWKLGMLKPKCEPLRYQPPDDAANRRAAEIKQVIAEELGDDFRRSEEPRFQFLSRFYRQTPPPKTPPVNNDQSLRFIYSYFAPYGDPLSNPKLDPYPDGLLHELSAMGVNGVWLHVVLRDLAPGGKEFPEFGKGHERRLANLKAIVDRAAKFGIGVYLYMNEPRAMPDAFFRDHPDLAGVRGTGPDVGYTALCISQPAVRRWLGDSLAYVFREVPGLGGVFTITASEALTNCASHGTWQTCPHCKARTDAEIIAETNATIEAGVHRGSQKAKFIAWDWGWRGHGDAPDIVAKMPKATWLMSVSEWALPIDRGGVHATVGEYAMSVVGPGPRATRHWTLAKEAGLKTVAKVQLNNTWELSTVPYLPVMDLVAGHCRNLASSGVDGMMLSWSLGGYPSPNLEIAKRFSVQPTPSLTEVLDDLAVERYGDAAPLARKAWTAFSTAFQEYPYHGSMLYASPMQVGSANLLYDRKTGYAATPVGIPYDDLAGWRGIFSAEAFASQFEKTAQGWRLGIPDLKAAVQKAPATYRDDVRAELRFAQVAGNHFQAVANQTRFVLARDRLEEARERLSPAEKRALLAEIRRVVQFELDLAREEFRLVQEDSRIGFEASNQYVFVPIDLAEKIINCRWILQQFTDSAAGEKTGSK